MTRLKDVFQKFASIDMCSALTLGMTQNSNESLGMTQNSNEASTALILQRNRCRIKAVDATVKRRRKLLKTRFLKTENQERRNRLILRTNPELLGLRPFLILTQSVRNASCQICYVRYLSYQGGIQDLDWGVNENSSLAYIHISKSDIGISQAVKSFHFYTLSALVIIHSFD